MTYALAPGPAHFVFYQRRLLCGARAAALWFGDVSQQSHIARPSPKIPPRDRPAALFGSSPRRIDFLFAAEVAIYPPLSSIR